MRNLAKRVEELRTDNENTLIERISMFIFYSLALDENTYIMDTAQLVIFI